MKTRMETRKINVNGVQIGGQNKVIIQSMCNIKTSNVDKVVEQILNLEKKGCQIIRVSVMDKEDAIALSEIKFISLLLRIFILITN